MHLEAWRGKIAEVLYNDRATLGLSVLTTDIVCATWAGPGLAGSALGELS